MVLTAIASDGDRRKRERMHHLSTNPYREGLECVVSVPKNRRSLLQIHLIPKPSTKIRLSTDNPSVKWEHCRF
ncbi:hypothetical protein [Allocoleopsis franciscana]|uniref:hypothetical protein n=1 Tax=Allocoleopsis franciscana TaxID=2886352 RepID=UPI0002FA6A82|nr:hypothetical protein [Allocoleopsis franciscana]